MFSTYQRKKKRGLGLITIEHVCQKRGGYITRKIESIVRKRVFSCYERFFFHHVLKASYTRVVNKEVVIRKGSSSYDYQSMCINYINSAIFCAMVSGLFIFIIILYIPKQPILNSSKLKQSAGDNLKFVEKSSKFSKRVENTVGKGEHFTSNFSFSHSVFKGLVSKGRQKVSLCENGLSYVFFYLQVLSIRANANFCCCLVLSLSLFQTTNFRLLQTERLGRQQF